MKTSLEDISPVKKKLLVEVESREVDKKLNEAYRELGKRAKISGFRPGKIPRKILERHYGDQVAEDVIRDLVSETFPQAVDEAETFPLGTPLLERETLKQGQNFKYSAVLEVRPRFEIKDYLGIEVEKEKLVTSEEDVLQQIDQIRESHGKLKSVETKRPIQDDDYVVLDYEGFEDGRALDGIKSSNFLIKVGSQDFHPEFEKSLLGLNKDAETEIDVEFEESYFHSRLAGKKVTFKVRITDIKKLDLPELNDEFAQNLDPDLKNMEELKNKVRETITAQKGKKIDREVEQRLLQQISNTVEFELPQVLVESELDYAFENVKQSLIRSGSSLEKTGLSEEKIRKDFRPASEKRVKEMLILGQIARQDQVTLSDEDLEEGIKSLAATTGQDVETLRKYYEARNLLGSLREKLLEEKTLNYLVEHAKITVVDEIKKDNTNSSKEKD